MPKRKRECNEEKYLRRKVKKLKRKLKKRKSSEVRCESSSSSSSPTPTYEAESDAGDIEIPDTELAGKFFVQEITCLLIFPVFYDMWYMLYRHSGGVRSPWGYPTLYSAVALER